MNLLEEKIRAEIDWRIAEIATLKVLPAQSRLSEEKGRVLKKYTIPVLYSLWSGFVEDAFSIYVDEINALQLSAEQLTPKLLAHNFEVNFLKNADYLKDMPADFEKRADKIMKFACDFKQALDANTLTLAKIPPIESNIGYDVIEEILIRFNLSALSPSFETQLDKFLIFKQKFAYGDSNIPIKQADIDEFSELVITLMDELLLRIMEGFDNKTYLSQ